MSEWSLASGFRSESFGTATGVPGATVITSNASANTKGTWVQLIASTSFDAAALLLHIDTQFLDTQYLLDIGIGGSGSEQVFIGNVHIAVSTGMCPGVLWPLGVPEGSRIAVRCQDNFGGSTLRVSGNLFSGSFVNMPPCQTVTTYGANTAASAGTLVDAGAVANTKGSWAQITSATTRAHKGLIISVARPDQNVALAADYAQLLDIGVGAAASEKVLIPDVRFRAALASGGATGTAPNQSLTNKGAIEPAFLPFVPCDIPEGVRLAARQQSSTTDAQDRTSHIVIYGLG